MYSAGQQQNVRLLWRQKYEAKKKLRECKKHYFLVYAKKLIEDRTDDAFDGDEEEEVIWVDSD